MRLIAVALCVVLYGCDERECLQSHKIPVTYYIQTGKVLVPVITWVDFCDEYADSKVGTEPAK